MVEAPGEGAWGLLPSVSFQQRALGASPSTLLNFDPACTGGLEPTVTPVSIYRDVHEDSKSQRTHRGPLWDLDKGEESFVLFCFVCFTVEEGGVFLGKDSKHAQLSACGSTLIRIKQ